MWSDVVVRSGVPTLVTDAIFAPSQAWYVRAATDADRLAVVANVDGRVQAVNDAGQRWDSGEAAHGEYPAIIQRLLGFWEIVWMQGPEGKTCGRVLLDADMHETTRTVIPGRAVGTAQGLSQFANGALVFTDDRRSVVCGAFTLFLPTTIGDFTIGHDGSAYRVLGWRASTSEAFEIAPTHSQTASHMALDEDGLPIVAVAQTDQLVPFAHWTKAEPVAPSDEPAAHVPRFAPYPCQVSVFDQPGTALPGVFYTVGRDDLQAASDAAKAQRLPLLAYVDGPDYPASWVPGVPGVEVIPTVMGYPRKTGATMQPVLERAKEIAATVMGLRVKFPRVAVVFAAYRQIRTINPPAYNWPLQHVLDLQQAVWDVCNGCDVRDRLVFVWTRGNGKDGVVSRPEFGDALNGMLAAAMPVPAPLPTPTPQPPKPEPPPMPTSEPERPNVTVFVEQAIPAWIARHAAANGGEPAPADVGDVSYATLIEGGELEPMPATSRRAAVYTKQEMRDITEALAAIRQDAGGEFQLKFLALWAYQILIEGKRYSDVVADAAGVA